LNVRAAWPVTRGAGVLIAQGDDGMDLEHPDLVTNTAGAPHYDFFKNQPTGLHPGTFVAHGTAVAGLIAAESDNGRGVSGVAPSARLASWVIFNASGSFVNEVQAKRMFEYASNVVAVQNHSWGNADPELLNPWPQEVVGISNAVTQGRDGRGVVMVRAAGNERQQLNNANDDGYANDTRVITVGAVRNNGTVTSYSTPGACVLVAAFSDDANAQAPDGSFPGYPTLTTTDRRGYQGYNRGANGSDADYAYAESGFKGTSGATPQISGLCALILAVNPTLTVRDVQQVLIHAARPLDRRDPAVRTNGAGFLVSHNNGFGVPDAGQAVALARLWKNRPALETITVNRSQSLAVPDDSLRVEVSGTRLPPALASIPAYPVDGLHVDEPTADTELVDVGTVPGPITQEVRGKAVLIQLRTYAHAQQLAYAAQAGAAFAIIQNNSGTDGRAFLNGRDVHLSPIPAVCIGRQTGDALRDYLAITPDARARITLNPVTYTLPVDRTLLTEHVTLRVRTSHRRRADLRITLVSPAGTRSVLQHFNNDLDSPLDDWTYSSVQHFYESSAGDWRVEISDERAGVTGRVLALDLTILGVPLLDSDRDGLDDDWERAHFENLYAGPAEDPDRDGLSNLREQLLDTDPRVSERPFALEVCAWDARFWRLSWPALTDQVYGVFAASVAGGPYEMLDEVTTESAHAEWLVPANALDNRFFRVEARDLP
jgi:subtilisin-like proprotein convertase family protein